MKPYMFVIIGVPFPNSKAAKIVSKAYIHCWVMAENKDQAIINAFAYIRKYLWEPIEIEHAFEIDPLQIPDLHEEEQSLYRKALKFGIAADFHAGLTKPDGLPEGSFLKVDLGKIDSKD